jgi:chromosome segregation ATPase
MLVDEKLAPLCALQSSPPPYVHEVRFDAGADGEVWAYVLAQPDPLAREKQRFLCVVARSDRTLAMELQAHEASLAAWTSRARAESEALVQRAIDMLRGRVRDIEVALSQSGENALAQAKVAVDLAASADRLRATIEPLRATAKPEVRGQVALLELELGRAESSRDASRQATDEHRARALELSRELELARQALAQAEANFESAVSARLAKHVPPTSTSDRIRELQAELGRVVVHASETRQQRMLVEPGEIADLVATHAEWLRGQARAS